MPIGCQTYPVRNEIGKDLAGTLADLKTGGMEAIELCSPHSYREFAPLAKMSGAELKKAIGSAGLRCESCHYNWKELRENLDERIAYAKELGLRQMVLSSFGFPATAKLADWSKGAEEMNGIAEKIHKAGMAAGFHNHNGEFAQLEGTLIYEELMKRFDPKLVGMQFQTAVVSIGYQAADYFEKYPGRFLSIHAADWSAEEKKQVPLGKGAIDWKRLFGAAKKAGVKNYFLEMNPDLMKASVPYLKAM
jgi:sugar phosphate isomerase/epimerase